MNRRALPAFAAVDFLSCMLVVFVAVALVSAKPEVKTFGSYAVVMTWPPGPNDVDLYVRDPSGAISYFSAPQVDAMQLEHDDLGTGRSNYGSGKENEERTIIRTAAPGQWVVNAHMYDRRKGTVSIPVTVSLWDLRASDHVVETRRVYLTRTGDDRTPFRFTIGAAGGVSGFSYTPVSLVSPTTAEAG